MDSQGAGPAAGSLVFDLTGTKPGTILHRASILRELLAPVPEEVLHANKRLAKISDVDDEIQIVFEDGTVGKFDAVIGADGIFGAVRQHVVQDFEGDHTASPAGFWDCRNLVPFEKAKSILGEEHFEMDRQYGWVGPGALLMHDILEDRKMVQCVATAVEKDPPKNRKRPLNRDFMEKVLHEWPISSVAQGMIDVSQSDFKARPEHVTTRGSTHQLIVS